MSAQGAVLSFLACAAICVCGTSGAHADSRFGDSTWVAPGVPFDSEFKTDGPRVAPPDHERRWEAALRAPFRLVFLPLRLMAKGIEAGAGHVGSRLFVPKSNMPPKPGPSISPHFKLSAPNDIGVGPGLTWIGFPTTDSKLQLAGSWSAIDHRQVRFSEVIHDRKPVGFRLSAIYDRKPNRRYYGIGNGTPETDLSYFLLDQTKAEAALLLGASPLRQLRVIGGYSRMSPKRGYHGEPLIEDVFTPATAPFTHQTTQELSYGLAADLASLDSARDPSRGVHGRAELRHATGLRSKDPDYIDWRVEGRAYVPVFASRRVIAVRGVYAGVEPSGDDSALFPYYRLAQSHGDTRFAGYASERFRDRQLLLARVEYRWVILHRMSAIALYELGEVAPSAKAFTLRDAHESFGGGLRLGLSDVRTVRFELAKGFEGISAVLALEGDF